MSEETLAMFLKFTKHRDLSWKHDSSLRPVAAARSFSPFAADYRLRAQRHRAVCPGKLAGRPFTWHTIVMLSGLMLLTKGIELSGYFDVLGRKMARRFVTERQLAIFMVLAAALLSTFLDQRRCAVYCGAVDADAKKMVRHPGEPADYFRSVGGERRFAADANRQPAEYFAVGLWLLFSSGLSVRCCLWQRR